MLASLDLTCAPSTDKVSGLFFPANPTMKVGGIGYLGIRLLGIKLWLSESLFMRLFSAVQRWNYSVVDFTAFFPQFVKKNQSHQFYTC